MSTVWNNALGVLFVANPRIDSYGLVFHHGVMRNPWSIYGEGSWHGLGGTMAFPQVEGEPAALAMVLGSLGVAVEGELEDFDLDSLTADQRAAVILQEAAERVAGKGMAMTPKWRFIDEGLRQIGAPLTGLGGGKAILIHPDDPGLKRSAIEMLARATLHTGAYISGPDQNMGVKLQQGLPDEPADIFARIAPFHMAGSPEAHKIVAGRPPSNYTGDGVYEGIRVALKHVTGSKKAPLFIQGNGGVGSRVLERAITDNLVIAGISDASVKALLRAQQTLRASGILVWDRKAARRLGLSDEKLAAMEAEAYSKGIQIADGLVECMDIAMQKGGFGNIGILSPNADPHAISLKVLEALKRMGVQAVIGGANNMLALDESGSYLTVARRALELKIFIPNDSAINRMGATIVLYDALGLDDAMAQRLTEIVGERVADEWFNGQLKGIPPQVYSDRYAKKAWNDAILRGEAMGGLFTEVLGTEDSTSGSGGGGIPEVEDNGDGTQTTEGGTGPLAAPGTVAESVRVEVDPAIEGAEGFAEGSAGLIHGLGIGSRTANPATLGGGRAPSMPAVVRAVTVR
ncbi:MAG: hypothetical protein HY541_03620 [Deltaproteobacteria bacterium]|nr:hypothetical protein [Deltaproteobacteria bacterium]